MSVSGLLARGLGGKEFFSWKQGLENIPENTGNCRENFPSAFESIKFAEKGEGESYRTQTNI